jgi:hypothetical protein
MSKHITHGRFMKVLNCLTGMEVPIREVLEVQGWNGEHRTAKPFSLKASQMGSSYYEKETSNVSCGKSIV